MSDPITAPPAAPSRSAPSTFSTLADAFIAWFAGFVIQLNAVVLAMNWNALTSTSTTSDTIALGATSLTVNISKSYLPGHTIKIARTSSPSNWMHGDVTSYNSGTGALVVNVTNILGSGTFTDWTITFSAPTGLPVATAENDVLLAGPTPFAWVKKTITELKTILFNSPTFVTPALGTPASGTLTNCTSATPAANDNTTKLATTEFIQTKFGVYDIHEETELCGVD